MDKELVEFLIDQFSKLPTREDLQSISGELHRTEAALRKEMHEGFASIRAEMATKSELAEVKTEVKEIKEIVLRLDRRTDEDIRATMKDVEKIKTYLVNRGHQI